MSLNKKDCSNIAARLQRDRPKKSDTSYKRAARRPRTYLNIDFDKKNHAKRHGAQWEKLEDASLSGSKRRPGRKR